MKSELTIDEDGTKEWKLPNSDYHREDGPAIKYDSNIYQAWFLDDIEYTEIRYKEKMRFNKLKKLL